MNNHMASILDQIVDEDYPEIPEYAFSVQDYEDVLRSRGLEIPGRTTMVRRLNLRVDKGELIRMKTPSNRVYYVPTALKKNMELDEKAIKEA